MYGRDDGLLSETRVNKMVDDVGRALVRTAVHTSEHL